MGASELKLGSALLRCYALDMSEMGEDRGWQEFRDQCRRQMRRPLEQRIKYGFCHVHKPVLDDVGGRAFASMREYRQWCERELPAYLGYGPAARDR